MSFISSSSGAAPSVRAFGGPHRRARVDKEPSPAGPTPLAYEQVVQTVPLWTPGALDIGGSERLISARSCSNTAGHVRTARAGLVKNVPESSKSAHGGNAMARRGPLCGGAVRSCVCSIARPQTRRAVNGAEGNGGGGGKRGNGMVKRARTTDCAASSVPVARRCRRTNAAASLLLAAVVFHLATPPAVLRQEGLKVVGTWGGAVNAVFIDP